MSNRPKQEPKRRRVSREYERFMEDISADISLDSPGELALPVDGEGPDDEPEIFGDDQRIVRIWPELGDRIIEDLR